MRCEECSTASKRMRGKKEGGNLQIHGTMHHFWPLIESLINSLKILLATPQKKKKAKVLACTSLGLILLV